LPAQSVPAQLFQVVIRPERERVLVVPQGELDLATVDQVEREIQQLRARGFSDITLDLRQITFMDSTGMCLLLRLDAAARSDGSSFAIIDAEGPIRRLLTLTRLRDRFHHAKI
jgi:anti-sigma B factor antagonist